MIKNISSFKKDFFVLVLLMVFCLSCKDTRKSGSADTELYVPKEVIPTNPPEIEAILKDLQRISIQIGDMPKKPVISAAYVRGYKESASLNQIQWSIKNTFTGSEQRFLSVKDLPSAIKIESEIKLDPLLQKISLKITSDNIGTSSEQLSFTLYFDKDLQKLSNTDDIFTTSSTDILKFTYSTKNEGTSTNPWGVYTYKDLYDVRFKLGDYFLQLNDINLPALNDLEANRYIENYSLYGWEPIGNGMIVAQDQPYFEPDWSYNIEPATYEAKGGPAPRLSDGYLGSLGALFFGYPFTGVFDGQNFKIRGLTIKTNEESSTRQENNYNALVGLFGASAGVIKNIQLIDINIISSKITGGLVGILVNQYCKPTGDINLIDYRIKDDPPPQPDCYYKNAMLKEPLPTAFWTYDWALREDRNNGYFDNNPYPWNDLWIIRGSLENNFVRGANRNAMAPNIVVVSNEPEVKSIYVSGSIAFRARTKYRLRNDVYKLNVRAAKNYSGTMAVDYNAIENLALGGVVGYMQVGNVEETFNNVNIYDEQGLFNKNIAVGGVIGMIGLNTLKFNLNSYTQNNNSFYKDLITVQRNISAGSYEGALTSGGLVGFISINPNNFFMFHHYRYFRRDTIHLFNNYSTATVIGDSEVGGLVGATQVPITIEKSYFNGSTESKAQGDLRNIGSIIGQAPRNALENNIRERSGESCSDYPPFYRCLEGYFELGSSFQNVYTNDPNFVGSEKLLRNLGLIDLLGAYENWKLPYPPDPKYGFAMGGNIRNGNLNVSKVKSFSRSTFGGFDFTNIWELPSGGQKYPILKGRFGGAPDLQLD